MIKSLIRIIKDAGKMVAVNIREYALLSVTIIISFSALGIYMLYTDSSIFNEYKDALKVSSKVAFVSYGREDKEKAKALENSIAKMKNSYCYISGEMSGIEMAGTGKGFSGSAVVNIHIIPNNVWGYYYDIYNRVEMKTGNKNISVKGNSAIVSEGLYNIIKDRKDGNGDLYLKLPIATRNGESAYSQFLVSGICNDYDLEDTFYNDKSSQKDKYYEVFISYDAFKDGFDDYTELKMSIYTDQVKEVENMAKDLGLNVNSALSEKDAMNEQFIASIKVREGITIGLLFLLGVNLLSCFSNALNERKFEVSVRRAIGASRGNVIFQFFAEGIIVMLVDILISIATIMISMCGIKLYKWFAEYQVWSIRITSYSVITLVICSVFLSLFFSVLFAVMSSRVEIVKYLKCE